MYNSLIRPPIEKIQDAMERQEKALQLSRFEFLEILAESRSKSGLKLLHLHY